MVTRDQMRHAKPDPNLFIAAAECLGVDIHQALVIGDSVRDMLAAQCARTLGACLLSGGHGQAELQEAGTFRVYTDPADLLRHIDEMATRD